MSEPANNTSSAEPGELPTADYILVALDASPHSQAALAAAAELAAALHLELRGLFVEDINLLYLCGLPFGLEIGSFTAKPRRLEQRHLEREFRMQADLLRKIMADVAGQRRVSWSFQVVRGAVTDQLLAAAASARMLTLGRVGHSPGKRTGSTAQAVARHTQRPVLIQIANRPLAGPFTIVFTGGKAGADALALAIQFATRDDHPLTVLLPDLPEIEAALTHALAEVPILIEVIHMTDAAHLVAVVRSLDEGTLILPAQAAPLLEEAHIPVIVAP